ncbi:MAG: hypothetical protein H0V25_05615 [Solirubrobacterales bacterium]|nr:hypothetical protein [Solirubrobacterales bacterium]
MLDVELKREGTIAYREAVPQAPESGDPVMIVHGFPQSSYMWALGGVHSFGPAPDQVLHSGHGQATHV